MSCIRTSCPKCGGRIVVSFLYQLSYDYTITKRGKLSKRYKVTTPGPMEVAIAACEHAPDRCRVIWEADDFVIDENERFVDYKYCEEGEA